MLFGVGATKAGTSWLHDHLSAHPECHFRSIKELHYFDTVQHDRFNGALRNAKAEVARLSDRLLSAAGAKLAHLTQRVADLNDWIAVLTLKTLDWAAYRGYLTRGAGARRLVGDVTPAYALLPEARLRDMAGFAPDVRFVYLMRDPVARFWSHVRMLARRGAPEAQYAQAAGALFDRITGGDTSGEAGGLLARGDYRAALEKLDRAVDPARLLVMFQEELMTIPGLARLSAFLGIADTGADFDRRVHEGLPLPLTVAQRTRAQTFLRPQYDYAATRFPALPDAWRRNMGEGVA